MHDKNGKELDCCPRCGYTGKSSKLTESDKNKIKEEFEKRHPETDYSTREARAKWFPGLKFKDLVYSYHEKINVNQIHDSITGEMACLNENESKASEMLIDIINIKANSDEFWNEESNVIFNNIWDEAENILEELNIKQDDYLCFSLFQIVLLNFAFFAHENKDFRNFICSKRKRLYYQWVPIIIAGGYILYHIIIDEVYWSTFLIAGLLMFIVGGYFYRRH